MIRVKVITEIYITNISIVVVVVFSKTIDNNKKTPHHSSITINLKSPLQHPSAEARASALHHKRFKLSIMFLKSQQPTNYSDITSLVDGKDLS